MKALVTTFNDKLRGVNPMVSRLLYAIPGVEPAGVNDCDVVFLSFIAPECDFAPDIVLINEVSKRRLPVIIFDHSETFPNQFVLGRYSLPPESNYKLVESLLDRELETKAYFKRELGHEMIVGPFGFPVHALDWTLSPEFFGAAPKVDTEAEYHARPIDIFYSWGYSNESRPKLMGELLRQAGRFNSHFCLTEEDLNLALAEGRERIFALLFTPHYRRIHINQIIAWQQRSKISISMFGAGKKCFRAGEASYNCVMAQQEPREVIWSYPWVPSENCVGISNEEAESVNLLHAWLRSHQGALYPTYLAGIENSRRYLNSTYAKEYMLPKILEALK